MNPDAVIKLKMLKGSRRCLIFGLLGFIPAIGLVFALIALWISGTVWLREKQFWNAAKPYRLIGTVCASVSAIVWSGILIIVFGNVLWRIWAPD
jgi:hypothetical protein